MSKDFFEDLFEDLFEDEALPILWEEEDVRFDLDKILAEDLMPPVMETKAVLVLLLSLVCGPFSIFTESWVNE